MPTGVLGRREVRKRSSGAGKLSHHDGPKSIKELRHCGRGGIFCRECLCVVVHRPRDRLKVLLRTSALRPRHSTDVFIRTGMRCVMDNSGLFFTSQITLHAHHNTFLTQCSAVRQLQGYDGYTSPTLTENARKFLRILIASCSTSSEQ